MKKLLTLVLSTLYLVLSTAAVKAEDSQIICPQPYGGGVVCGIHTTVNTGLGDNLAMVGGALLVSSLMFLVLSKKFNKVSA